MTKIPPSSRNEEVKKMPIINKFLQYVAPGRRQGQQQEILPYVFVGGGLSMYDIHPCLTS